MKKPKEYIAYPIKIVGRKKPKAWLVTYEFQDYEGVWNRLKFVVLTKKEAVVKDRADTRNIKIIPLYAGEDT